jgi:hypothetical protein
MRESLSVGYEVATKQLFCIPSLGSPPTLGRSAAHPIQTLGKPSLSIRLARNRYPLFAIRKAAKWAVTGRDKLPSLSAFIDDVRLAVGSNVVKRQNDADELAQGSVFFATTVLVRPWEKEWRIF